MLCNANKIYDFSARVPVCRQLFDIMDSFS